VPQKKKDNMEKVELGDDGATTPKNSEHLCTEFCPISCRDITKRKPKIRLEIHQLQTSKITR
jgi:hypothetical protein